MSLAEKMDLLSCNMGMLMEAPFSLFAGLVAFFLPLFFQGFQSGGAGLVFAVAAPGKGVGDYLSGFHSNQYWTFDFFILVVLGVLFPVFPVVLGFRNKIGLGIRYLLTSAGIYASLAFSSLLEVGSFLFTGKTFFPVTGAVTLIQSESYHFFDFRAGSNSVLWLELFFGGALLAVSFQCGKFWLLPVALGTLASVLLLRVPYKSTMRLVTTLPFLIQLTLLALVCRNFFAND